MWFLCDARVQRWLTIADQLDARLTSQPRRPFSFLPARQPAPGREFASSGSMSVRSPPSSVSPFAHPLSVFRCRGTRALFLTRSISALFKKMIHSQVASLEKIAPSGSSYPFFFLRFFCFRHVVRVWLCINFSISGRWPPNPFWQSEDSIFKTMRDVQRIILLLLHPRTAPSS